MLGADTLFITNTLTISIIAFFRSNIQQGTLVTLNRDIGSHYTSSESVRGTVPPIPNTTGTFLFPFTVVVEIGNEELS